MQYELTSHLSESIVSAIVNLQVDDSAEVDCYVVASVVIV